MSLAADSKAPKGLQGAPTGGALSRHLSKNNTIYYDKVTSAKRRLIPVNRLPSDEDSIHHHQRTMGAARMVKYRAYSRYKQKNLRDMAPDLRQELTRAVVILLTSSAQNVQRLPYNLYLKRFAPSRLQHEDVRIDNDTGKNGPYDKIIDLNRCLMVMSRPILDAAGRAFIADVHYIPDHTVISLPIHADLNPANVLIHSGRLSGDDGKKGLFPEYPDELME
ncbi:hypothetical protein EMPG_15589 [Blastomyces silverae]|uniref:Aminoglycoside phosphotransferase domain-containing protein n=1 Tax=Blastomyces silverae TaxID=2060906 RepID=A0A0H1BIH7_9EURO|nr:hypothetical protein EMPG_15589 [Blastomyces silverae]